MLSLAEVQVFSGQSSSSSNVSAGGVEWLITDQFKGTLRMIADSSGSPFGLLSNDLQHSVNRDAQDSGNVSDT